MRPINLGDFSEPGSALDLVSYADRASLELDVYKNHYTFDVRVLTKPLPFSENGIITTGFKFMGRIIDPPPNSGFPPSPHRLLPNPCRLDVVGDDDAKRDALIKTIKLHTEFVSGVGSSTGEMPNVGDRVLVVLKPGNYSYNLRQAQFTSLRIKVANASGGLDTACDIGGNLAGLFDDGAALFGENIASGDCGAGGARTDGGYCHWNTNPGTPKDDPTFAKCASPASTYAMLPKTPTIWPATTSQADTMRAIRASGQSESIQRMMYLIISHEQPSGNFLNYNVAGIQLDNRGRGFAGASASDFDFMSCYRDSGNDQRIFAGFNSLERGMMTFGKIVAAKVSSVPFKALTGTDHDADAETMTWNYYRQWNLALSDSELAVFKETDRAPRGDAYVDDDSRRKSWTRTRATFKGHLLAWGSAGALLSSTESATYAVDHPYVATVYTP